MYLTYILTYLRTPWSRVLLEKLTGLQLIKKFPAFYGTRKFFTAITSARHLSLSGASSIQSISPHYTPWRSSLILFSHLRLCQPNGLFPPGFPTKTLYTPLPSPYALHAQPISFFSIAESISLTKMPLLFFSISVTQRQIFWATDRTVNWTEMSIFDWYIMDFGGLEIHILITF